MSTTISVETDSESNEAIHWIEPDTWIPGTDEDFYMEFGHIDVGEFGIWTSDAYVRFANVTIPEKATIVSAYIQFYGANMDPVYVGTATGNIYGIDEDNTANFAADASGRSLTTANVAFSFTSWTALTADANSKSGDLKTIVQEIVDRAGWASGNAMGFRFDATGTGNNYVRAAGNDATYGGPTYDAELDIVWKYRDSGMRIYSGGAVKIGRTETDDSALMLRKGATNIGIPLVSTGHADAGPLRFRQGGTTKSIAKTT